MVRLDTNRYALKPAKPAERDPSKPEQENVREVVLELGEDEVEVPPEPGDDRWGNAIGARRPGIVISHGCEIDKATEFPMVTVAQVRDLAGVHEDDRDAIRTNENKRAFYLPASEQLGGEHYVDFRYLTTIRRDVIDQLERVASMNLEGRQLLHFQWFRFFARKRLPDGWESWPDEVEE